MSYRGPYERYLEKRGLTPAEPVSRGSVRRFADWLFADNTFLRVTMFLVGSSIVGFLCWAVAHSWPIDTWVWIFVALFGALGGTFLLLPLILDDYRFERSLNLLSDGGDIPVIIFFLAVLLVAIPLTVLVKLAKGAK
jgi:hypothetical protein